MVYSEIEKQHRSLYFDVLGRVVEKLSGKVTLAFFHWWKEPGNAYVTFYPASWITPERHRMATESSIVSEIRSRAIEVTGKPTCITLGSYGDPSISLPAWSVKAGEQVFVCNLRAGADPDEAAEAIVRIPDWSWTISNGAVVPRAQRRVLRWIEGSRPAIREGKDWDFWALMDELRMPYAPQIGEGSNLLDGALRLAAEAHVGQVDRGGQPYILHPIRLMMRMETMREKVVALLHDVWEDSHPEFQEAISQLLFRECPIEDYIRMFDALHALWRKKDETYEAYIRRVAGHRLARRVKLVDLEDNMNLARIHRPKDRDFERIKRYAKAYRYLREFEDSSGT